MSIMTTFVYYNYSSAMNIGKNIKKIREQRGLMQKEVASAAAIHTSNYSKIEKGEREPSIEALDKIATLLGMTVDEIIHFEGKIPREVKIKDKTATEKLQLIEQLDDEDKQAVYRIIDGMLTKSKFKDFFQKNVAAL
jgi:transcriptional regulator with XRE-family HTH domain